MEPIKPEDIAISDQNAALLADSMPAFLWRFYSRAREEGFTDDQAMLLTVQCMLTLFNRSR